MKERTRCPGAGWARSRMDPRACASNVRLPAASSVCLSRHDDSEELEPQHTFQGLELRKADECPFRTDRGPRAPKKPTGWPKAVELLTHPNLSAA